MMNDTYGSTKLNSPGGYIWILVRQKKQQIEAMFSAKKFIPHRIEDETYPGFPIERIKRSIRLGDICTGIVFLYYSSKVAEGNISNMPKDLMKFQKCDGVEAGILF